MKRALYIGPSHAAGGIPVTVDGVKQVEVEGMEYKICGDAYRSNERLDFKAKTNLEILDFIHNQFACKFEQNKANGNDFIICKLAVRDLSKHDRSGTVREILDQIQGEVGCKLSDGSLPEPKLKAGGVLHGGFYKKRPLYRAAVFPNSEYATGFGILSPKGISLSLCDQISEFPETDADVFDISECKLPTPSQTAGIIQKAITIPGNTTDDLRALSELENVIPYYLATKIESLIQAAKILGYDGLLVTCIKDFPTECIVWNLSSLRPVQIYNPHNYKFLNRLQKYEDGGEINDETTGYAKRVYHNLSQMGSTAAEWTAVPIIGTEESEGRIMPVFDFPKGYEKAPSLYKNSPGAKLCCELCGKEPISILYYIQNDSRKWTLTVGSECIKHFDQKSGEEMLRDAKIVEAKNFTEMLSRLCLFIKSVAYGKDGELGSPNTYKKNMFKWKQLYRPDGTLVNLWNFYNDLYPHSYQKDYLYLLRQPNLRFNNELKKWISYGPADPNTCKATAEKNLLSWYSRNKDKKNRIIAELTNLFQNQDMYMPEDLKHLSGSRYKDYESELKRIINE